MTSDEAFRHDEPGGPEPPDRKLILGLIRAATTAPSMHNTQPWRFEIDQADSVIGLSLDPARLLPTGDPHGRASHIACGAALFNLRLAAAVAGWQPTVRLVPEPTRPLLVARVRLSGTRAPAPWELELRAAIPLRHTNRGPFSNRAVPPGIRAELADAAIAEGAMLHFADGDETVRLRDLAIAAERELLGDPAYRAEMARWVGGERAQEGIPASALGPRSPEGREPVRDFNRAHRAGADYAWFEEDPQLAVLSVLFSAPADWLAAGQALERVWLTATCRGISVCPLTPALETTGAWLVRDPRDGNEQPQMILRLGYGLPIRAAAPRRPLADVVDWHPAGA